ncbi:neprilysin-1-like [Asterias rubens]|uniref:neprilysin-1-like n=1 Tax=Asterias rubens TaxID=7604 RepID=UPI001454F02C|nr:neprilysin-1-like [Asterias rubens]
MDFNGVHPVKARRSTADLMMDDNAYTTTKKPGRRIAILTAVVCVLAVLCIVFFATAVVFVVKFNQKLPVDSATNSSVKELCVSQQCIKSAAVYLDSMNTDVDPCDNFFEYACGGWVKKAIIPEDKSNYFSYTDITEQVTNRCRELFERDTSHDEPRSLVSVRNYYKSCLDEAAIEKAGTKPLVDLLTALGGWPVLGTNPGGNWDKTTYKFETFLARLISQYNIDAIISSWVSSDSKNSSGYVVQLDQPGLGMGSRDYYLKDKHNEDRAAYVQYMVDVVVQLGVDEVTARASMEEVMELETALANMTISSSDRRDSAALYNIYTLYNLTVTYPQIDWVILYNALLPDSVKPIPSTERIVNKVPSFMSEVTMWLSRQSSRVVMNYMIWRLVDDSVFELGKTFVDIGQKYINVVEGTSASAARWERCVEEANNYLRFATGRMYVEEYFPGDAKEKTLKIVGHLKTAFKEMLETNDWLQEADKKVAAEKADSMRVEVGYPDWIIDDTKLDEYYNGLDFVSDSYFTNSLIWRQWSMGQRSARLRSLVDKTAWTAAPTDVNAYYSSSKNRILFTAGILQPPFYHHDLPLYYNYGGIGVVIGHEITHGFDDKGRQYDKDGNLNDWWSEQSVFNFKERAQCMVDQYSNYVMPETNETLNGKLTQGENIADNGGLKEAYKSYKDNIVDDPLLPGLNFNQDQMFFLSFGQLWCSVFRPEGVTSYLLRNRHSPGRYRVIGTMQNNEDFAKAFNCSKTSYMNPVDKCSVW